MAVTKQENVKWVDGLRGVASFLVVVTHLSRAFDTSLFAPNPDAGVFPRVAQWPVIRVAFQGRIGVAVFSLVTGYVCALKPIRLARASNYEGALESVAKSAFRRIPRLILPATIATALIWLLCQFGAFSVAKRCDSQWIEHTSPTAIPYIGDAIYDLIQSIVNTWVYGATQYDPNQWTLMPLLKGSMLIYISIFATLYMQPKYRMLSCMGMWVYYCIGGEYVFGMQFFFGFFMSDLQQLAPSPTPSSPGHVMRLLQQIRAPILLFLGLYLASYPEIFAERCAWSAQLQVLADIILRRGADYPRFYTAIGLELVVLGIHYSPTARDVLSNKYFLWLGKNSFAVYLLHGTFARTVLTWFVYGVTLPEDIKNDKGDMVNGPALKVKAPLLLIFWIPLYFMLVYSVAIVWTTRVDPLCAEWSRVLERHMWKSESQGILGVVAESKRDDEVVDKGKGVSAGS